MKGTRPSSAPAPGVTRIPLSRCSTARTSEDIRVPVNGTRAQSALRGSTPGNRERTSSKVSGPTCSLRVIVTNHQKLQCQSTMYMYM